MPHAEQVLRGCVVVHECYYLIVVPAVVVELIVVRVLVSASQLGTLRWKYSRVVRTIVWMSDRTIAEGL